jgi:hypothetical protein
MVNLRPTRDSKARSEKMSAQGIGLYRSESTFPQPNTKTDERFRFGGTSIGKFADNIAEDIVSASIRDNKIAVVCSARSTGRKVEGTTSR